MTSRVSPGSSPAAAAAAARTRRFSWNDLSDSRLPLLAGVTFLLASLPLYTSYENRAVLGRWSQEYVAAMAVVAGVWLLCVVVWRRAGRRGEPLSLPLRLFDLGVFLWGAGYLAGSLVDNTSASRLLDFKPFGSVSAVPAVVEWLALVVLVAAAAAAIARTIPPSWHNAALSVGVLAAIALAGEGVARAKAIFFPSLSGFPTNASDIWMRRYVTKNTQGYRDEEHTLVKPAGTRRLVLVGDSYTYGWGIPRTADRLGEQLGERLRAETGERWEVINLALPDQHTLEEVELAPVATTYDPDVVILVYVFNDIDYLSQSYGAQAIISRNVLSEAPRTILDRLHPVRLLYWNSYLFQEAYVRVRALSWRFADYASMKDLYADSAAIDTHMHDLERFVRIASSGGALMGIVPFDPSIVQYRHARNRYERFVETAERRSLPVWSLRHAFGGHELEALMISAIDGHPNELANALAAEAIAPVLLARLAERGAPAGTR
ncbi:MAG: SGNH/GDSL hydrolase family protein [Gemmatimonadaceae bacterium]